MRAIDPGLALRRDTLFTTFQVAGLLQIDPTTVTYWLDRRSIAVGRTPGGHRRVPANVVLELAKILGASVPAELRHLVRPEILFVDDDPRELRALERLFKPYAELVVLHTCDNGIDALMMIGDLKPTLIILDVIMPGLDGVSVCRRIRANPTMKNTKVLIVSANMTPEIEQKALAAGADRALEKPIDVRETLAMVGVDAEVVIATG